MASLSVNITASSSTSAKLTGTWQGDSGSQGARYLLLDLNGVRQDDLIVNVEGGSAGSKCTFSYVKTGLRPKTTYNWKVMLAWGDPSQGLNPTSYTDSGTFTTPAEAGSVEPWDWQANTERENALAILEGTRPADDFSHTVWNDLVDKIMEAKEARNMTWSNAYATLAKTKADAGDTLSAARYNSIRYNVNNMEGVPDTAPYVSAGDQIFGKYITIVVSTLNTAISNL